MEAYIFNNNQCVLIENREQYLLYYPQTRSAKWHGMSLDDWEEKFGKLQHPFYIENSYHVTKGHSIGRIHKPIGTWSREHLEILKH